MRVVLRVPGVVLRGRRGIGQSLVGARRPLEGVARLGHPHTVATVGARDRALALLGHVGQLVEQGPVVDVARPGDDVVAHGVSACVHVRRGPLGHHVRVQPHLGEVLLEDGLGPRALHRVQWRAAPGRHILDLRAHVPLLGPLRRLSAGVVPGEPQRLDHRGIARCALECEHCLSCGGVARRALECEQLVPRCGQQLPGCWCGLRRLLLVLGLTDAHRRPRYR